MRRAINWWVLASILALTMAAVASADDVRVQSTSDTADAGLIDPVTNTGPLATEYAKQQPGDQIKYTAVGTGKALDNAKAGLGDIVITHAPSLEAQFVAQGYSIGPGRQIFYSDYVIVGPTNDPAGVLTKHPHDAVAAFEDIAAAGEADATKTQFKSRQDNSGTNVQEQLMWGLTASVTKQHTAKTFNDDTRFEPGSGGNYPAWYARTGKTQGPNLLDTEACAASGNGCYTMVDRGTFNRNVNNGTVTHLKIVNQVNDAGARGGKNLLINPFSAYLVNPDAISGNPKPNVAAARRFLNFLVSPDFQKFLVSFPTSVDPAFRPDAFPNVSLDGAPPAVVAPGATVTITGTVTNLLPGGGPDVGQPVQLEQSTDGGKTYSRNAAPVQTDSNGHFSTSLPIYQRSQLRLSLDDHAATAYNQFTATTVDVGTVDTTPAVTPTPTATPTPSVTATPDTKKPGVSNISLTRKKLSLRLSEAADFTVTIQRKGKKGAFRKVAAVSGATTRAATISKRHKALKGGRYRLKIIVTDTAGNTTRLTKSVTRG